MITKAKENAVNYIRMSDLRQDGSPEQQRMELEKLAKEYDCQVIREYLDEGKSGAKDIHKRDGFNQMIKDAETLGDFSVILVRDIDRFGRFGPREANYYWERLAKCGVRIISAAQGEIDTDELAGWLTASITQHGKHQFVKDLARNVIGGYVRSAQNNKFSIVVTPYGYSKQVIDEHGDPVRVVKRTERFTVPKTWTSTLILGDSEEVETVKFMFDEYAHKPTSLRAIAAVLNRKGISPPRSSGKKNDGQWGQTSVRAILRRPVYQGDYVFGRRRNGAFYFFTKDGPVKRDASNANTRYNSDDECKIIRDAFEPIIDRKTFELVQKRLERNQQNTSPNNNFTYPLRGILKCGHCGYNMRGVHNKKNGKSYANRYVCGLWQTAGMEACKNYSINEDWLQSYLVNLLIQIADSDRSNLKKAIEKQLNASSQKQPAQAKRLQSKLGKLDADIKKAVGRLALCNDDIVGLMTEQIGEMRSQRGVVASELASVDTMNGKPPVDADSVIDTLDRLGEDLRKEAPELRREIFQRMLGRIDLYYGYVPEKKTHKYPLERGIITLTPEAAQLQLLCNTTCRVSQESVIFTLADLQACA